MEFIILFSSLLAIFLVFRNVDRLKKEIQDLHRENDNLLDSSTNLFYENRKLKEEIASLKKDKHDLNLKIKKITEFFGKV